MSGGSVGAGVGVTDTVGVGLGVACPPDEAATASVTVPAIAATKTLAPINTLLVAMFDSSSLLRTYGLVGSRFSVRRPDGRTSCVQIACKPV